MDGGAETGALGLRQGAIPNRQRQNVANGDPVRSQATVER